MRSSRLALAEIGRDFRLSIYMALVFMPTELRETVEGSPSNVAIYIAELHVGDFVERSLPFLLNGGDRFVDRGLAQTQQVGFAAQNLADLRGR